MKVFFFIWNIVSITLYSAYTLFVIYKLSINTFLSKAIKWLLVLYIVAFGLLILIMLVVFSLIGMIDTLYESYRARKSEFTLYENSGMSKRTVRKMKFFEVSIAIAFGFTFGCFTFLISSFGTNSAFYQFGLETFINFFKLFK